MNPPTVICLKTNRKLKQKTKIHEWGPSLENSPENVLYIGRNFTMGGWRLPKSKWFNPFKTKDIMKVDPSLTDIQARDIVKGKYIDYIKNTTDLMESIYELEGKQLACWCHPDPCHGDALKDLFILDHFQKEGTIAPSEKIAPPLTARITDAEAAAAAGIEEPGYAYSDDSSSDGYEPL